MGIYCLLCRATGLAALAFAAGLGLSSSASAGAGHDEDEEIHCLALTIYYEARGEPQIGKLAVGHVVMNRARSGAFPDGVCDVVREGGARRNQCQFSWYCDGLSDRPRDAAALRESLRLAQEIYDGCTIDPSEGALFFHATSVRPAWRKWAGHGERIGRHVFYRGKSPAQLEPVSATADRCVEPAPPRNDTEVATRPIPPRGSQLTALPPALPALPRTR
jgi:cell wall hydrolase